MFLKWTPEHSQICFCFWIAVYLFVFVRDGGWGLLLCHLSNIILCVYSYTIVNIWMFVDMHITKCHLIFFSLVCGSMQSRHEKMEICWIQSFAMSMELKLLDYSGILRMSWEAIQNVIQVTVSCKRAYWFFQCDQDNSNFTHYTKKQPTLFSVTFSASCFFLSSA